MNLQYYLETSQEPGVTHDTPKSHVRWILSCLSALRKGHEVRVWHAGQVVAIRLQDSASAIIESASGARIVSVR